VHQLRQQPQHATSLRSRFVVLEAENHVASRVHGYRLARCAANGAPINHSALRAMKGVSFAIASGKGVANDLTVRVSLQRPTERAT